MAVVAVQRVTTGARRESDGAIRLEHEPRIALVLRLDSASDFGEIGHDGFEGAARHTF
jgi:hypothetical protein